MKDYFLKHLQRSGEALRFRWDPNTGELAGPGREIILSLISMSEGRGHIGPSWPFIDLPDPLTTPQSMAVLLHEHNFELPPELATLVGALAAKQRGSTPEGAIF